MTEIEDKLDDFVTFYLDKYGGGNTFEELLEEFDLSPSQVFIHLYNTGMLNPETLKELTPVG